LYLYLALNAELSDGTEVGLSEYKMIQLKLSEE